MNILKSIAVAAIFAALSSVASADIVSIYSQDFNSMGTGTTAPAGWAGYSISGSHDTFKPADDPTNTGVLPTGSAIKGGTAASLTAATPAHRKAAAATTGPSAARPPNAPWALRHRATPAWSSRRS